MKVQTLITDLAVQAKRASNELKTISTVEKNRVLATIAELLLLRKEFLIKENEKDLEAGKKSGLSAAMLDRLCLDDKTINQMVKGLNELQLLEDPVGRIEDFTMRPNGLKVGRMRIPLGVIAMIYESRPNVTIDAAGLCLKTGNAVILRGGSEAISSNLALAAIVKDALRKCNVNEAAVQVVPVVEREAVQHLLTLEEYIDLVIPRGGEGLIRSVVANSTIPVLKHYKGVCHIFIDRDAELKNCIPILLNAKAQRPGVCNALEGILVDEEIAEKLIADLAKAMDEAGVELRGCDRSIAYAETIKRATDQDWGQEFLELICCIKIVSGIEEALEYIEQYGSGHTETILTENYSRAERFIAAVDASAVMVNASTRFNDGGQLGLGTEIGISTTKLHAYGPMGLLELTTKKFVVYGQGQIRE